MARRRVTEAGPGEKERTEALHRARTMTGYLLCHEVDRSRGEAVKTMGPAELRQVVAEEEDGIAPSWFRESILEDLDLAAEAEREAGR